MTILVIGGPGGMVAGALAQHPGVVALGRPDVDLARADSLGRAVETHAPTAVICAGAFTKVDAAEIEFDEAMRINAEGSGALAIICAAQKVPLLYISTDYVFDGVKAGAYVEADATAPINAYGRSKLAGENAVRAAGGPHAIVRTSWVHASIGFNFVRTMLRLATTRERIAVVDDQRGSPTYAPHLATALLEIAQALGRDPSFSGVYHVTDSGACTWREFAETIFTGARARGGPAASVDAITTAAYPTLARRPLNSLLDSGKARRAFGLVLPDWRIGLHACLDEIAANGWRLD